VELKTPLGPLVPALKSLSGLFEYGDKRVFLNLEGKIEIKANFNSD
jgi:hypothetical protein